MKITQIAVEFRDKRLSSVFNNKAGLEYDCQTESLLYIKDGNVTSIIPMDTIAEIRVIREEGE